MAACENLGQCAAIWIMYVTSIVLTRISRIRSYVYEVGDPHKEASPYVDVTFDQT